ncbi:MAG: substrate-binding domain-containing protein [Caldimonas sp.]
MSPPGRPKGDCRAQHEGTPATREIHLLCAGAVQGLVEAVSPRWLARAGVALQARFGAVGAMQEALASGAPCDLLIVTEAMLGGLSDAGAIDAAAMAPVGRVRTGVAARAGAALPRVDSPESLKAALLAAPAVYLPDLEKSTAGAHLARVLDRLGVRDALMPRLAVFANGAAAMQALAELGAPGAIGCTQVTEILRTPGLALAGTLPEPLGLATVYCAGVATAARQPALATALMALLCGPRSATERRAAGFEPLDPDPSSLQSPHVA